MHLLLADNFWDEDVSWQLFRFLYFFLIIAAISSGNWVRTIFTISISRFIFEERVCDTLVLLKNLINHKFMLTRSILEHDLGFCSVINMSLIIVIILDLFLWKHNLADVDCSGACGFLKMFDQSR